MQSLNSNGLKIWDGPRKVTIVLDSSCFKSLILFNQKSWKITQTVNSKSFIQVISELLDLLAGLIKVIVGHPHEKGQIGYLDPFYGAYIIYWINPPKSSKIWNLYKFTNFCKFSHV